MKKLIELFETQIELDKENRISYSILNAKNHLIKNLIELQINKDEKNKISDTLHCPCDSYDFCCNPHLALTLRWL